MTSQNQVTRKSEEEDLRIAFRERCDKIEPSYKYLKRLTLEEIQEEKERLVEIASKLADLEEAFKRVKVEHKAKIDPVKGEYFDSIDIVRSGKKWTEEEVYIVFSQETREAVYYTAEGILVNQRPLTPGESQISIFNPGRDK